MVDTLRAFYVWEIPHYPAYYVPVEDVDRALLALPTTQSFESGPFAGLAHVDWNAVDAWYEEDKEVFGGHPSQPLCAGRRDPLLAPDPVEIEASSRRSTAPVLLFETGLPTRHYIQRTDLHFAPEAPRP